MTQTTDFGTTCPKVPGLGRLPNKHFCSPPGCKNSKCGYTCPACHLCAPLKIAQNVLTDSVIYVTLYTNNRFGYLKEQNSNGKIFSAFTGETGNNP